MNPCPLESATTVASIARGIRRFPQRERGRCPIRQGHVKAIALIGALVVACLALYLGGAAASPDEPGTHKGLTAAQWHTRYVKEHRLLTHHGLLVRTTRRQLLEAHRQLRRIQRSPDYPSASYAIRLASSVFGVSYSDMWNVAACETGHTFNPYTRNSSSSASGLFQFLDSTWANQGVAGFSVYDPVANALGAARIVAREGWKQWVCRP